MASELSVEAAPMTKELLLSFEAAQPKAQLQQVQVGHILSQGGDRLAVGSARLGVCRAGAAEWREQLGGFPQQWRVWLRSLPKCDVS